MRNSILLVLAFWLCSSALEIEMRDGELITGDLLWENSGRMVIKSGSETIAIYKRSISRIDTIEVEGRRDMMLGEEYILREKNELMYINGSDDSLTIRFRNADGWGIIAEVSLGSGDSTVICVPDGEYLETVRFWRPDGVEYYNEGSPYSIETDEKSYERYEFELPGYEGDTYPTLIGPKRAYEEVGYGSAN